jgi:hypothetical protein
MDEWGAIIYPFLREINIESTYFAAPARLYLGGVRRLRKRWQLVVALDVRHDRQLTSISLSWTTRLCQLQIKPRQRIFVLWIVNAGFG